MAKRGAGFARLARGRLGDATGEGACSLIKNPAFARGSRTVHIRPLCTRVNVRSHQLPHVPPSSPTRGEEGGKGEGEGASAVLRSTGTEYVEHPYHRGRATHALPTNGSHQ